MKPVRHSIIVAALFAFSVVARVSAETATIPCIRDNTLYEDAVGAVSNGIGDSFFIGRTNGNTRHRGLVRFDLSGIPVGSEITSAVIHLRISRTMVSGVPVRFHRIAAEWGEGTSNAGGGGGGAGSGGGAGAAATPNDATWLHRFYNGAFWASAGGDFTATPSGEFTGNGVASYAWTLSSQMIADLQSWLGEPDSNFGWCMLSDETQTSSMRFDSREHSTAAFRPRIVVEFTPPPPPCDGDPNADGIRNGRDIQVFIDCVLDPANGPNEPATAACLCSDIDGDEDVDMSDLSPFVSGLLAMN